MANRAGLRRSGLDFAHTIVLAFCIACTTMFVPGKLGTLEKLYLVACRHKCGWASFVRNTNEERCTMRAHRNEPPTRIEPGTTIAVRCKFGGCRSTFSVSATENMSDNSLDCPRHRGS